MSRSLSLASESQIKVKLMTSDVVDYESKRGVKVMTILITIIISLILGNFGTVDVKQFSNGKIVTDNENFISCLPHILILS